MKFPKFMKPKTLFSGLSVARQSVICNLQMVLVSADTITWQLNQLVRGARSMMHFERDGRESRSKYVVLEMTV